MAVAESIQRAIGRRADLAIVGMHWGQAPFMIPLNALLVGRQHGHLSCLMVAEKLIVHGFQLYPIAGMRLPILCSSQPKTQARD